MKKGKLVGVAVLVVVIGIQFVPVDRSNPPVRGEIEAPPRVAEIFRRSCYDCHSHETDWPWYSRVAPVSWVLAHHVDEGRSELNFSTWSDLGEKDRSELVHDIWEETSEGHMPLREYLILHPEAKLSDEALETIHIWSGSSGAGGESD